MKTATEAGLPLLMSTNELAEILGVDPKEIRRLESEGVLQAQRGFRRPKRFSGVQVFRWLEGGRK